MKKIISKLLMCYILMVDFCCFFFFKQKTAYEIGTGDWSSDVCSSDLSGKGVTSGSGAWVTGQQGMSQKEPAAEVPPPPGDRKSVV